MELFIDIANVLIIFILLYQRHRLKFVLNKHKRDMEKIVRGYRLDCERDLKRNYDLVNLVMDRTGRIRSLN